MATQGVVKTLTSEQALETKTQILICNTFHLHLKPGERNVKASRGLHAFMHWPRPLMTDSGGFQVFSLGFGRDLGIGKIVKGSKSEILNAGAQPQALKITDRGVWFRSPLDGEKLFLGPRESMRIQSALGADIAFAFDECPPPAAGLSYVSRSLSRTHDWALASLEHRSPKQALFGIVQGGRYKRLRIASARFIGSLPFDGFGIGGEFGSSQESMERVLAWTISNLPREKPRHLLGIGHPEDIPRMLRQGVDLFDCIVPTHYGRHGIAFTSSGRLDLMKSSLLRDRRPLDPRCACKACAAYTRGYVSHLFRAKEITGMALVSFHNLWFYNTLLEGYRAAIRAGRV